MINKLLNMFDKFNIKRASELIKKETFQPSGDLSYNIENIILPEYQHVKTPLQIEEFLGHLKIVPIQPVDLQRDNFKFCVDSLANSRRQEKQANPISVETYWPLFNSLDEAQKKWYFYWRKEVLNGNYRDTEASYLLIFVYELLNYTFNDNAAFNLSMLDRLYMNYHDRYSILTHYVLGQYLAQWISDFCYELGDYDLEKKWACKVPTYGNIDYETLKQLENKLETVSISFWKRFISYNKTKFFGTNRNLIYKIFKASVSILETNYQVQGKKLIDEWMPQNEKARFKRLLFKGAVIGRKVQSKIEFSRSSTLKMREDLTALFRLAENIARMKVGEKRQLSVDETLFPEGFKNTLVKLFLDKSEPSLFSEDRFVKARDQGVIGLGSAIPTPPETLEPDVAKIPIIQFDLDRIDTLDKESKELLEIFALRYDDEEESDNQDKSEPPEAVNSLEPLKISDQENKQPLKFLTPLSSDEDLEPFIAELNDMERDFLLGFKDLIRATQEAMQYLKAQGIMMGVFISTLNEKSLEYLGDNLVEQDGEVLIFNEDFEQVLDRLLSHMKA